MRLIFYEFSVWMRMSRFSINNRNCWCYYSCCCPLVDPGGTAGEINSGDNKKTKAGWSFNIHFSASKMRFGSAESQSVGRKGEELHSFPTVRLKHRKRCLSWRPGCDSFWITMHDGNLYYRQLLCEAALFISCGLNDAGVAAWDELAHLSVSSL